MKIHPEKLHVSWAYWHQWRIEMIRREGDMMKRYSEYLIEDDEGIVRCIGCDRGECNSKSSPEMLSWCGMGRDIEHYERR